MNINNPDNEFFLILNRLYDKIPCGLAWYTCEPNSRIRFLNKTAISLLGFSSKNELLTKGEIYIKDFVHPDDYNHIFEVHNKLKKLGDSKKVELRIIGKNGISKLVEGVISLEKAYSGSQLFHFSFSDVTLKKQLEEDFIHKSNEFSTLINNIPGGVCTISLQSKPEIIYTSEQTYSLFGMDKQVLHNLVSNDFFSIFHPEDVATAKQCIEEIKTKKISKDITLRIIYKKKEYKYINFRVAFLDSFSTDPVLFVILFDIDNQKQTEENLLKQKQLVNLILHQSDVMLWMYDIKNSKCTVKPFLEESAYKNNYFPDVKNFPESFIKNKLVSENSVSTFIELCNRLKNGETNVQGICEFTSENATSSQWRKIHYINFFDDEGKPSYAIGCATNITEAVILEQRFKEELDFRQEVNKDHLLEFINVNLTKNCIIEHNVYSQFDSFKNSSYSKFISYCAKQIISKEEQTSFLNLFSLENIFSCFNSGEKSFSHEYKISTPDKFKVLWINIYCRIAIEPVTGDLFGFFYTYDITEQKNLENIINQISKVEYDFLNIIDINLDQSETQYKKQNIVPNVPGLGNIKPYDSTVKTIIKMYIEEATSNKEEILSLYEKLELKNIIKELESKDKFAVSFSVKENDETIHRKKWQYIYLDETKQKIIHSQSDITDVYKEEIRQKEILKNALIAAEQANKAKTEFLSRMSHEIRTPMNAIIGMAELAQQSVHNTELVIDSISKVSSSARFLLNLINDILDMSRIESGRTVLAEEIIDFSTFIENISVICETQAKQKDVNFQTSFDEKITNSFIGDKTKIQQVLINIISNGIKFTPSGGSVQFIITQKEINNNQGILEFIIKDDGIGISPNFIKHLFEPFSQEHIGNTSLYGGTGLGLAISKNFISLMGGTINVESKPGFGTTFTIQLKLNVAKNENKNQISKEKDFAALSTHDFDFTGKRVLLVEDHILNIEVAKKLLVSRNLDVDVAENGVLAIDIVKNAKPNYYDAILMDIRMPLMDGLTATKAIRNLPTKWTEKVPIIAMTANAFEEDIQKTKEAGMNAHLSKPIEPNLLFSTLANFIL